MLVVGDLMLDRYVWGDAERISQEAPVILLHADKREERLGGASSVATMLRALGARSRWPASSASIPTPVASANCLRTWASTMKASLQIASVRALSRNATSAAPQHRHPQQMMRVDYETRQPVSPSVETELGQAIAQQMRKADMVLISDYDKGVCTPRIMPTLSPGLAHVVCGLSPTQSAAATTASITAAPQ